MTQPETETPSDSGFGGWLLVFAFFLWALFGREAVALLRIAQYFAQGQAMLGATPYSVVDVGRLAINGAFVGLLVVTIVLMHLRRAAFLRWGRIAMLALIAVPVLEYLWLALTPLPGVMQDLFKTFAVVMLLHLAIGGAWLGYLSRSKRVAATFVL